MVRETRLAPNVSITFGAGDSDGGESSRRPRQSLQSGHSVVWLHLRTMLHALHTYFFAMAPVIFTMT